MKYDVIIGMEIHAELKTKSKMFCSCDNDADNATPNQHTCPICLAHPGTLPVPNKQAIEWTILTGLALHCQVAKTSKFDRKNYFYPDIPKGYQISQYDLPLVFDGYMVAGNAKIAITRIHLEEDTAKSSHPAGKDYSLIDFNRAGTPLMELVTEPVIPDAETAKKFCQNYQQILRYLDISDADMEKGHMRCEANVSIQEKGKWEYQGNCQIVPLGDYKLNPKAELKNINSFKAIEKAINYEVKRQIQCLEDGEPLIQETRGWDENKNITVRQRVKETAADYRYFPEPDIPPMNISEDMIVNIRKNLIEMPPEKKVRFADQYGFSTEIADILASDKYLAAFTENTISELLAWINADGGDGANGQNKLAKIASNWLVNELFKHLSEDGKSIKDLHISPENFAEFIKIMHLGKVNSSAGQTILETMYKKGGDPSDIMAELGLEQIEDDGELEKIIKEVLEKNPIQVEQFRAGKEALLQFLVGQTMAAAKGKANPKTAAEIIRKLAI